MRTGEGTAGCETTGRRLGSCLHGDREALLLAAEAEPVLHEVAAQLADAAGADAVLVGQVHRSLVPHHVVDEAAVTVGACPQPGGKVDPERSGVGRWGDRV